MPNFPEKATDNCVENPYHISLSMNISPEGTEIHPSGFLRSMRSGRDAMTFSLNTSELLFALNSIRLSLHPRRPAPLDSNGNPEIMFFSVI